MWHAITERISGAAVLCAVLSVAIPWFVRLCNRKLHQYGDPPWKEDERQSNGS